MNGPVYDFLSDNVAGAAPELLQSLLEANQGTARPYGDDDWTRRMSAGFTTAFEREVQVFAFSSGTGANSVALAACANPYGAILCHETAHINVYECGAPEFFTGAKLIPLPGADCKIDPAALEATLAHAGQGNPTRVQPFALNITQPTDFGTLYTVAEITTLCRIAHEHGLKVHMDGARFANALAALDCSPAAMTWQAGVDLLSFGATKNGAINAEAVVVFDASLAQRLPFLMKRGGQTTSKTRFISAQLARYVADDLWLERARAANANTAFLAGLLRELPQVQFVTPPQINMLFLRMPERIVLALEQGPFRFYRLGPDIRLVCRHDQEREGMVLLSEAIAGVR